jgi:hypothetical protein
MDIAKWVTPRVSGGNACRLFGSLQHPPKTLRGVADKAVDVEFDEKIAVARCCGMKQ